MRRLAMLVVLGLGAACAGLPAAPGKGGPPWIELTSEHFTVWTDGEPVRVRALVRKLEQLYQVMVGVAYPTAPTSGRSVVVVLRNEQELRAVDSNGEPRAYAVPASAPLWQPLLVLSLTGSDRDDRTVAHELTHLVSFAVIHNQPRWLAEGMAVFFETVSLDADRTTGIVGTPPARRGLPGYATRAVSVSALFAWRGLSSSAAESTLYTLAWAVFSFLINEHPAELGRYLWLIDRIDRIDPARGPLPQQQQRAWDQAFPSLPVNAMDPMVWQWLRHGRHMVLKFIVRRTDWPINARRLSDADAYAIRTLILEGSAVTEQRGELAEALAAEPTNVLAWAIKLMLGDKPTVDVGRAITAAHPDDWRAWWLAATALAEAQGDPSELEAARSRACGLIAQNRALEAPPQLCDGRGFHSSSR
jgi:hypothetical protein